jgi:hypothetical protein
MQNFQYESTPLNDNSIAWGKRNKIINILTFMILVLIICVTVLFVLSVCLRNEISNNNNKINKLLNEVDYLREVINVIYQNFSANTNLLINLTNKTAVLNNRVDIIDQNYTTLVNNSGKEFDSIRLLINTIENNLTNQIVENNVVISQIYDSLDILNINLTHLNLINVMLHDNISLINFQIGILNITTNDVNINLNFLNNKFQYINNVTNEELTIMFEIIQQEINNITSIVNLINVIDGEVNNLYITQKEQNLTLTSKIASLSKDVNDSQVNIIGVNNSVTSWISETLSRSKIVNNTINSLDKALSDFVNNLTTTNKNVNIMQSNIINSNYNIENINLLLQNGTDYNFWEQYYTITTSDNINNNAVVEKPGRYLCNTFTQLICSGVVYIIVNDGPTQQKYVSHANYVNLPDGCLIFGFIYLPIETFKITINQPQILFNNIICNFFM